MHGYTKIAKAEFYARGGFANPLFSAVFPGRVVRTFCKGLSMKIEFRIENGAPLLVFPGEMERDKSISVWSQREEHATAQRAYLRSLRKPETEQEKKTAWRALRYYCNRYASTFE